MEPPPMTVIEQLHSAMNRHDLEAFVACFDADYVSEQPAHPNRVFRGREQVRKNWTTFFHSVPDLQAEIIRAAEKDSVVWTEWRWHGTRLNSTPLDLRGVTIFGVRDGLIAWGRLYMEDTEAEGGDIDERMQHLTSGTAATK